MKGERPRGHQRGDGPAREPRHLLQHRGVPRDPQGQILLRLIPTAAHTLEDVRRTIQSFKQVKPEIQAVQAVPATAQQENGHEGHQVEETQFLLLEGAVPVLQEHHHGHADDGRNGGEARPQAQGHQYGAQHLGQQDQHQAEETADAQGVGETIAQFTESHQLGPAMLQQQGATGGEAQGQQAEIGGRFFGIEQHVEGGFSLRTYPGGQEQPGAMRAAV
jgi:hypothetical protein